tara:strand:- start:244 stop:1527 length:1284 start_codon:yes stop_codon:yes gene_type:complete
MLKKIIIFLSVFLFCNTSFAANYYFNNCKLSTAVIGNYIINLNKNVIEVSLKSIDGKSQNFIDKIKSIEKNKIISEKIKSSKGKNIYYQYFLNSKSKTVIKLEYTKEGEDNMNIFKLKSKRESYCSSVKADWDKIKIDQAKSNEEEKKISEAQEKIKREQSSLVTCQGSNREKWTKCKGTYKTETGHKYVGLFIKGKIAKGTALYPGGATYVGDFKNYEPHGYGTFVWTNGEKYYGEWKNGKAEGNGTKIWKDGRKYLGKFKNDKLHGQGTLFYPDGKKYTGGFLNGKRHGDGTFTYVDGTAYIGKFVGGKEESAGICISKDGKTIPCITKADPQKKEFSGKDIHKISIVAKKWVRLSQYENNTKKGKKIMDKLKTDFETKALEICLSKGSYNVLQKRIEVLEIDETPAYGLETKVKIGIAGAVECK